MAGWSAILDRIYCAAYGYESIISRIRLAKDEDIPCIATSG
jgi:hypothetical protein